MLKFYEYNQNNSRGSFDFDETAGLTHVVLIEAESSAQADERARALGIYFDGVAKGRDCPCCGNRWGKAWVEGTDAPMYYGQPVAEAAAKWGTWMPEGKEICVHYLNRPFEWFGVRQIK